MEQYRKRKEQLNYLKQLVKEKMQEEETPKSDIHAEVGSYHILENQEYDRNRIARDLHDSTVQSLTSLVHKTELCMRLMDIDAIRVKLELQTMIETIRSVIHDMREIICKCNKCNLCNTRKNVVFGTGFPGNCFSIVCNGRFYNIPAYYRRN